MVSLTALSLHLYAAGLPDGAALSDADGFADALADGAGEVPVVLAAPAFAGFELELQAARVASTASPATAVTPRRPRLRTAPVAEATGTGPRDSFIATSAFVRLVTRHDA
jgi:hypothetical protein